MEIVDISKVVRRKKSAKTFGSRRGENNGDSALARIARLKRALDSRARLGDRAGFAAGRKELCDLIFAVVSEDVGADGKKHG